MSEDAPAAAAYAGVEGAEAHMALLAPVYATVDPPAPDKSTCAKLVGGLNMLFGLTLIFALPFVEGLIRKAWAWGYVASPSTFGVVRAYGLVLIFNAIVPVLFVQFFLAFFMVGKGRKAHGYKLPVIYSAVDIHVEDVAAEGALLSGGDAELAQAKLTNAVRYNNHQRVHQNAMESFPFFLALSLLGGLRYPVAVSIHGLCWTVGRFIWTRGYVSGDPIARYVEKKEEGESRRGRGRVVGRREESGRRGGGAVGQDQSSCEPASRQRESRDRAHARDGPPPCSFRCER